MVGVVGDADVRDVGGLAAAAGVVETLELLLARGGLLFPKKRAVLASCRLLAIQLGLV